MPDPDEGLPPAPLGDQVRYDDQAEDEARSERSVADLVAEDLDDPDTPSSREAMESPAAGLGDGMVGAPGFQVPTEPLDADYFRPIDDTPPL
jgi:hypothetical protein